MATLIGYALLIISLPSLLALLPLPGVRGAVPAGGMLGELLAHGLRSGFNWGAYVIAFAVLITAVFMTTQLFLCWYACMGDKFEGTARRRRKTGPSAEGGGALALLER